MQCFFLVGGFNPSEKLCSSNWIISPGSRGENTKSLKPPPSFVMIQCPNGLLPDPACTLLMKQVQKS